MKIRKLGVSSFRGVRDKLELDFTDRHKSVAIFGENGTGKSSITDSIEWFFTNRVAHLWSEDCKDEAIRNIFAHAGQCAVTMEFSESAMKSTKTIKADAKIVHSAKNKEFTDYIDQASKERILLRHADVAEFVTATKSAKREEIEKIIGYEAIKKFRESIRQTKSKLEGSPEYLTAKRLVEQYSSELVALTKTTIAKEQHFFDFVNSYLSEYKVESLAVDFSSYDTAFEQLKSQLGDSSRAEKRIALQSFRSDAEKFQRIFPDYQTKRGEFSELYSELLKDENLKSELAMLDFLNKGIEVLNSNKFVNCPFCQVLNDIESLRERVSERIEKISGLSKKFNEVKDTKSELYQQSNQLLQLCQRIEISGKYLLDENYDKTIAKITQSIPVKINEHEAAFKSFKKIDDDELFSTLKNFNDGVENLIQATDSLLQTLVFSEAENKIISTLQTLKDTHRAYSQRLRNKEVVNKYQAQIFTLGEVYEKFIRAQNLALQNVLNEISADVNRFFAMLHPNGTINAVQLKILGEQGIEFEYLFHGHPAYPPKKYLSESFLNSLGLSLFLASAKLFNEKSRFLILDDIVTSFDQNLRRRLVRLLHTEFVDWQLIILTHEEFLFQLMKREFPSKSWNFHQVQFDPESGSTIQNSAATQLELILQKKKTHDVSNDLRRYLERILKDICCSLDSKVSFRFNDKNELRMSDELLSAIRRSVKEHKCSEVQDHDIFNQLNGSILVTNRASHDSSDTMCADDIEVALADIEIFRKLFTCSGCEKLVSIECSIPAEKKITCKCGTKKLSWVI